MGVLRKVYQQGFRDGRLTVQNIQEKQSAEALAQIRELHEANNSLVNKLEQDEKEIQALKVKNRQQEYYLRAYQKLQNKDEVRHLIVQLLERMGVEL